MWSGDETISVPTFSVRIDPLFSFSMDATELSRSQQELPTGWNQPCLEEHLAEIATSIIQWREISPFLGLTEAEEHEILGAVPPLSVLEQKIAMLRLWKKKKGIAATYSRLCRAFRKCKQVDLEDKVKQILAESNSLVDEEGELVYLTMT